ncbi:preQ(1) synthase [Desulfovibrio ferrophilus]|uniref:NADPH-dependent 7-cyano-7-deazaguanine reductase n=1 Tax=Desulfovibrio ferrophilus TaxID=241368 RepID=A0A2Z6AZP3_9BACT|nr:preQ(1) synthase [Desulfovibrio ferrophilus]BBD08655.1 NADPH-dependent 7-cyano-7-deazaguaninereductase [Desulfovibrio ferrophilus]
MGTTKSQDKTNHLKTLGQGGQTEYQLEGPHSGILETFPNNFPGRPYIVNVEFPEYTSLCPMTGQPDFGTIIMEYVPDQRIVESKSFKLYMFAYRNHQSFMETIANTMLDDFVKALDPLWCRVKGLFSPRGATTLHVFAEHFKVDAPNIAEVRSVVSEWKRENNRHGA